MSLNKATQAWGGGPGQCDATPVDLSIQGHLLDGVSVRCAFHGISLDARLCRVSVCEILCNGRCLVFSTRSLICLHRDASRDYSGFHIGDGVSFFDDVKEWSAPFFDAHQLGVRLNFGIDVKKAAVDVKKT